MQERFDVFIKAIEKHIPDDLISKENLKPLKSFASLFPAKLSSFWGFECRIGEENPKADFLLSITSQGQEREIFASGQLPSSLQKDPLWDRVKEFSKVWADPESRLHDKADNIWLEFDTARKDTYKNPIPSFFFGPKNNDKLPADQHCEWTLNDALKILAGGAIPAPLAQKISDAFKFLPERGHIFQTGLMLSRPLHTIRLCIAELSTQEYKEYLKNLGWNGDIARLCTLIDELKTIALAVKMNIDILNGDKGNPFVGPRIGLECYPDRSAENAEDRLKDFLDYFATQNLCTKEKRDAMIAYEGHCDEWQNREIWPAHLKQPYSLAAVSDSSVIARFLHHVKVVFQYPEPLEAKAYLAVSNEYAETVF